MWLLAVGIVCIERNVWSCYETYMMSLCVEKGTEIQATLAEMTGQKTVPNVFIGSQHIGQYWSVRLVSWVILLVIDLHWWHKGVAWERISGRWWCGLWLVNLRKEVVVVDELLWLQTSSMPCWEFVPYCIMYALVNADVWNIHKCIFFVWFYDAYATFSVGSFCKCVLRLVKISQNIQVLQGFSQISIKIPKICESPYSTL